MSEKKDNTTEERDIVKEVAELRDNLLRDIEKIHKDTYNEVKEIMKKYHDKKLKESDE